MEISPSQKSSPTRHSSRGFNFKNINNLIEGQRLVLQGRFHSIYFSKFVNYLLKYGIVLVGTNLCRDEYFICARKNVVYYEAEHLGISKFNYRTQKHQVFVTKIVDEYDSNFADENFVHKNIEDVFTDGEIIFLIDTHLRGIPIDREMLKVLPFSRKNEKIIDYFIRKRVITNIYPLHNFLRVKEIWYKNINSLFYPKGPNIRHYFGEEVAFFFDWIYTYWLFMTIPASAAILVFILTFFSGHTDRIDNNPFVPIYSSCVIIWGFCFIKIWRRREHELAYEWDTIDRNKMAEVRPDFYGKLRYNTYSGRFEIYYPKYKTRLRICLSILVMFILLAFGFFLTVCSMNLRGIVTETTPIGYKNILYINHLHKYSEPNAIFDPASKWFFLPVIMHTSMVYIMNSIIFANVATKLTDYENHRTFDDYNYHLIMKRFIFNSIETYSALFYITFVELDSGKLRQTMHALFISDAMRHLFSKCLVPWITLKLKYGTDMIITKLTRSKNSIDGFWNSVITHDSYMADYSPYSDYLSIVIEYGYIALFASVSPIPAIIVVIVTIIELKTNCFKMLFLYKRPRIIRASHTGPWYTIIVGLTWLGVMTNIVIFGVTSNQMFKLFPQWFYTLTAKQGEHRFQQHVYKTKDAPFAILFLIIMEHIFFLIGLTIHFLIKDTPKHVRALLLGEQMLLSKVYVQAIDFKKKHSGKDD